MEMRRDVRLWHDHDGIYGRRFIFLQILDARPRSTFYHLCSRILAALRIADSAGDVGYPARRARLGIPASLVGVCPYYNRDCSKEYFSKDRPVIYRAEAGYWRNLRSPNLEWRFRICP